MHAVILAAGIGWRLGRGEARPPKCLLSFDGRTLLQRHIETLGSLGIARVHLGLGYQAHEVHRELGRIGLPLPVDTVFNPDFRDGNVVTLDCMRSAMTAGQDLLLMDADVLYDPDILAELIAAPHDNCFLMDRDFEPGPEPVKLCVNGSRLVEFSKQVPESLRFDLWGESVGFFKLSAQMAAALAARTREFVHAGRRDAYYEDAIRDLMLDAPERFGYHDVTGKAWIEIDFQHDVERAEREVLPRIRAPAAA